MPVAAWAERTDPTSAVNATSDAAAAAQTRATILAMRAAAAMSVLKTLFMGGPFRAALSGVWCVEKRI
jgi:hypothetical protein